MWLKIGACTVDDPVYMEPAREIPVAGAWDVIVVGGSVTIVVGQAAGTAAALCVKRMLEPRDIDVAMLRDVLRKNDVVLEPKKA